MITVQNIIVAIIVLSAVIYAGSVFFRKLKSFSPKKSSCGTDCGCSRKAKI